MDIKFASKSRFLPELERLIRSEPARLGAGGALCVGLDDGGYQGHIAVTIDAVDREYFGTDWSGNDSTRFPARVKAAATALRNCNVHGSFLITHDNGVLEIKRI
jgi:hypothetical protein